MAAPGIMDDLQLLAAAEAAGLSLSDVVTLYSAFQNGVPSLAALDKAGKLDAVAAALQRALAVVAKLLQTQTQRPTVIALADTYLGKV